MQPSVGTAKQPLHLNAFQLMSQEKVTSTPFVTVWILHTFTVLTCHVTLIPQVITKRRRGSRFCRKAHAVCFLICHCMPGFNRLTHGDCTCEFKINYEQRKDMNKHIINNIVVCTQNACSPLLTPVCFHECTPQTAGSVFSYGDTPFFSRVYYSSNGAGQLPDPPPTMLDIVLNTTVQWWARSWGSET